MLNSEVIFIEIVTGTSDFRRESFEKFSKKKNATRFFLEFTVGRRGQHNKFFFGLTCILEIGKKEFILFMGRGRESILGVFEFPFGFWL